MVVSTKLVNKCLSLVLYIYFMPKYKGTKRGICFANLLKFIEPFSAWIMRPKARLNEPSKFVEQILCAFSILSTIIVRMFHFVPTAESKNLENDENPAWNLWLNRYSNIYPLLVCADFESLTKFWILAQFGAPLESFFILKFLTVVFQVIYLYKSFEIFTKNWLRDSEILFQAPFHTTVGITFETFIAKSLWLKVGVCIDANEKLISTWSHFRIGSVPPDSSGSAG